MRFIEIFRGGLLPTVLTLSVTTCLCAQEAETSVPTAKVFQLAADDVTAMIASSGSLAGNAKRHFRSGNVVHGFESPQDTVTWTVDVPKEDDYVVNVLFSKREQTQLEVSSGDSVLTAPSTIRSWEYRPFFWRQELPGTLHLKAGANQVTLRLPDAKPASASAGNDSRRSTRFGQGVTEEFHLFSIELGTPAARQAQVERARAIRGDASWMIDGKYGIFVHWSSQSRGFNIDEKRAEWFQKSVEMFDVEVFADAIERTGAAWITFTATHQGFYWPGPNAAIDKVASGRTSERDLLGEIIDALDKRGIRTLFYLHTGYNGYDPEVWREALGAKDADTKRFSDNIEAILRECSLRYGKKLMGFGYMDGALAWDYPLGPSWEGWARAIKAGNPKAVVGLSSNRGPTVSPFSELAVTDGGSELRQPEADLIGPGKQLGDVTPAWWCLMDRGGWFQNRPMNGRYGPGPIHSTKEYVDFFKHMAEAKIPVTINLILTADVTDDHPIFNPECMAVMEEVRKAIRGEGNSQDLIQDDLVLDLNADTGLILEDGNMVTSWANQAPSPRAIDFKSTEEGRTKTIISQEELGTGRPTLLKNSSEINGHNSLIFREDELINDNDEAFDGMMTGGGYTWFAVIKPYKQGGPGKINSRYPNAFFGCLRSSGKPQLETGQYAGFWGSFYPDGRVYMGSRNGLNVKVRDGVNTPEIEGPPPTINEWHIIMGRQGSGQGVVQLELFVDDPSDAANSSDFPVGNVEPSRMAIGTERNAINHQGKESFDGELARLLMYETALDQQEMEAIYDYLEKVYFD